MKKLLSLLVGLMLVLPTAFAAPSAGPIVFLIDVSGSMKEEKIDAVKQSMSTILENINTDQEIEIITFNDTVNINLPPTKDKVLAAESISKLNASGDTSLYDAVKTSLESSNNVPPSQIVLLSDGEDTRSKLKIAELLSIIAAKSVSISTIGVQVSAEQKTILEQIASTSSGSYYDVRNLSALISTYQKILEPQLVLTNTTDPESTNFTYKKSNFIFEATISSIIAFLLLLFFLNLRKRAQSKNYRRARLQVLQEYSYRNIRNISSKIGTSLKSFEFVPARIEKYVKNKLELVHSEMTYESVIRILAGLTVFLSIIFTLLFQNLILGIIFGAGIVCLGFNALISNITAKQKLKFSMELPELLNILASALRAGLTLQQGLEAYASDSKSEVAREIRRAIGEIRVGTPIDEALMGVAKRMNSEDLEWAVTALSIQRVVGGSMATILTTTYETVKARSEIRREVRTLAAEGKLSAYVLMALPIGIFLFLLLTRREYVSAFWTNPMGYVLMTFVGVSMTFGWIWMKKIVEIKI